MVWEVQRRLERLFRLRYVWVFAVLMVNFAGCAAKQAFVTPPPVANTGYPQTVALSAYAQPEGVNGIQPEPLLPPVGTEGEFADCNNCAFPIVPAESNKVLSPAYIVEPPDILVVELVNPIPKPPYIIRPYDVLRIQTLGLPDFAPLLGDFVVQPQGTIDLGEYGAPLVAGLRLSELKDILKRIVQQRFPDAVFSSEIGLAATAPSQTITGQHLVRPDGSIALGVYGSVHVAQMPLEDARQAIIDFLSNFFLDPQVAVDVLSYNSKVYYVVTDNGGAGQSVVRLPITGNETVLDAVSYVGGPGAVSDLRHVWISRPDYSDGNPSGHPLVLRVDWKGIVTAGESVTNYQIMAGDRIYIDSDKLVQVDSTLAKIISPVERVLGVTLLMSTTVNSILRGGRRTVTVQ